MDPLALLPHRPPMRLIDSVVELAPGRSARGRRALSSSDFFFDGHFPGEPVVPAVILVEMIAQLGGLAAAAGEEGTSSPGAVRLRVAALGPFKFPHAARPGTTLDVEARVAGRLGSLVKIEGEVTAAGEVVATGSVTLGEVPAEPG